jgi:hypothetical protein
MIKIRKSKNSGASHFSTHSKKAYLINPVNCQGDEHNHTHSKSKRRHSVTLTHTSSTHRRRSRYPFSTVQTHENNTVLGTITWYNNLVKTYIIFLENNNGKLTTCALVPFTLFAVNKNLAPTIFITQPER